METKAISVECFENFIVLKRRGDKDVCISLSILRRCCPCAFCSGETDVFGNKYIGNKKKLPDKGSLLKSYSFVGLYAIRFIWGDGHSDGLYTFDLLKNLSSKFNEN